MDLHSEMILSEYRENHDTYKKLLEVVQSILYGFASSLKMEVNSVTGRIKTEKSLTGKLELKGYKYKTINDITDIVGARIVTFYIDEIDLLSSKITSFFEIDWDNSIDKRKMYKIDQFGYMSVHYICKIPASKYKDPDFPKLNDIRFEIQVRSVLQHAWATIYHDTGYKNDVEVPAEYLRRLNRLAGLLEIADNEFADIKFSLNDYRKRVHDLVKTGKLEEIELNGDSFKTYVDTGAFDQLNKRIASINNMDIEKVTNRVLLPVLKKIGMSTLKDLDSLIKNYSELAYRLCIREFQDTDIDIISSLTGPTTLVYVYILDHGAKEDVVEKIIELIYGHRRSNASLAKKLVSLGTTLGIVKE